MRTKRSTIILLVKALMYTDLLKDGIRMEQIHMHIDLTGERQLFGLVLARAHFSMYTVETFTKHSCLIG